MADFLESTVRDLNKGAGHKMIKKISPKKLWNNCLELEAYSRSNSAHGIYMLHGELPKTVMSGETYDISQFCGLGWYGWIYFRDNAVQFLDENIVLGRYLGPSIDISPAFTTRILKQNGGVANISIYHALIPEEIDSSTEKDLLEKFDG